VLLKESRFMSRRPVRAVSTVLQPTSAIATKTIAKREMKLKILWPNARGQCPMTNPTNN
jgi:hypothetical protein